MYSYDHFFELSKKKSGQGPSKTFGICFWKLHISANVSLRGMIIILILGFTSEKLEKLGFQKIIRKLFDGISVIFFGKLQKMKRGIELLFGFCLHEILFDGGISDPFCFH